MVEMRAAVEFARSRGRLPSKPASVATSLAGAAAHYGFERPTSLAALAHTLMLPGNFVPGQVLATSYEVSDTNVPYQADVFGLGADGTPWKFWGADTEPWKCGVVVNPGFFPPGAPIVTINGGTHTIEGQWVQQQIYSTSPWSDTLAVVYQDQYGHPDPITQPLAGGLTTRAHLASFNAQYNTFIAVDGSGTVQLFRQTTADLTRFGELVGSPITLPQFAPPGAPIAVSERATGLSDGVPAGWGGISVFVVGNDGQLWEFNTKDDGATWDRSPMPNPRQVVLNPSSCIGSGFQVNLGSAGIHGTQNLGYSQLDVFVVDASGNLQLWWESQGGGWTQLEMPSSGGLPPGAPVATGRQVFDEPFRNVHIGNQLDVFIVDAHGTLCRWWVYQSEGWNFDRLPADPALPPASFLATAQQRLDSDGNFQQVSVFGVGVDGRITNVWQTQGFGWNTGAMPGSDLAQLPPPL